MVLMHTHAMSALHNELIDIRQRHNYDKFMRDSLARERTLEHGRGDVKQAGKSSTNVPASARSTRHPRQPNLILPASQTGPLPPRGPAQPNPVRVALPCRPDASLSVRPWSD